MPEPDPPPGNLADELRSEGWRAESRPPEPPPEPRPARRPPQRRTHAHRGPSPVPPPDPPPQPAPKLTRHERALRSLRLKLLALAYSHAATGELVPGEEVTIRVEKEDLAVSLTIRMKEPPRPEK